MRRFAEVALWAASLPVCLTAVGCAETATRFIADSTGDMILSASPRLNAQWDYELFEEGLPGSLIMMESVIAVSPDNMPMRLELARNYSSYGYGWLEDRYEKAEIEGDLDRADRLRARTRLTYLRARDLGLSVMRRHHPGIDRALKEGDADLERYLKAQYVFAEDAPALFWTAMAWGSAVNLGRDDPDLIADLGTVKILASQAHALDPDYFFAAPAALLGALESAMPPAMGGKPEVGKGLFERALKLSGRRNHVLLVQYARSYALTVGDRALYTGLLQEVLDAGDQGDDLRLPNVIARRRAERYLRDVDQELGPSL